MSLRETYVKAARRQSSNSIEKMETRWTSPSNIALVKYWGKHGNQLPMNPSVSLTLSKCVTDTSIRWKKKQGPSTTLDFTFTFGKQSVPAFEGRIRTYLESIVDLCPFLLDYDMAIESSNSFPHSAGIASSASAFSALALDIVTMEDALYDDLEDDDGFRQKASFLARLGSGSACRSIFGFGGWWGKSNLLPKSSDDYAIGVDDLLHDEFQNFQDSILIVSAEEKSVSSSAGHHLMEFHPYRNDRLQQVQRHLTDLTAALSKGDLEQFGQIIEKEALSLHALMMSSSPGYFLITGQTIQIINEIRAFRNSHAIPCYFTLDAGPNIHLLYPKRFKKDVDQFISGLKETYSIKAIHDEVSNGPIQLK